MIFISPVIKDSQLFFCCSVEHPQTSSGGSFRHQLPHEGLEGHGRLGTQLGGQSHHPQKHPVNWQARWEPHPHSYTSTYTEQFILWESNVSIFDSMIYKVCYTDELSSLLRQTHKDMVIFNVANKPVSRIMKSFCFSRYSPVVQQKGLFSWIRPEQVSQNVNINTICQIYLFGPKCQWEGWQRQGKAILCNSLSQRVLQHYDTILYPMTPLDPHID